MYLFNLAICALLQRISWTKYYDASTINDFDHQSPYIIDPANPSNNVYLSGVKTSKDHGLSWKKFSNAIDELDLSLPLQTG